MSVMNDLQVAEEPEGILLPLEALTRDVREAVKTMDRYAVLELVRIYYGFQRFRIPLSGRMSALERDGRPPQEALEYFFRQIYTLEKRMQPLLGSWGRLQPGGEWALQQKGIGPVLCAGLMAHIDISKVHTAGAIWRFAGLDPSQTWDKGQKRPWNARLKVICWKIGDSFVKVSGREGALYGQLYRQRKQWEVEKNERGDNATCARETLEKFRITEPHTLAAYQAGKLPDGRVDARARRWVVKIFLAHLFEQMYVEFHDEEPPLPYILTHSNGEHVHQIVRPPLIVA